MYILNSFWETFSTSQGSNLDFLIWFISLSRWSHSASVIFRSGLLLTYCIFPPISNCSSHMWERKWWNNDSLQPWWGCLSASGVRDIVWIDEIMNTKLNITISRSRANPELLVHKLDVHKISPNTKHLHIFLSRYMNEEKLIFLLQQIFIKNEPSLVFYSHKGEYDIAILWFYCITVFIIIKMQQ